MENPKGTVITRKEIATRYDIVMERGRSVRRKAYVIERSYDAAGRIVEQVDYSHVTIQGKPLKKPGIWKKVYRYPGNMMIMESYTHPFKKVDHVYFEYLDHQGRKRRSVEYQNQTGTIIMLGETTWEYDAQGRLVEELDAFIMPGGERQCIRIQHSYDEQGRVIKNAIGEFFDDASNVTTYEYDQMGRRVKTNILLKDVLYGFTAYAYDQNGILTSVSEYTRDANDPALYLRQSVEYRYRNTRNKKTTYCTTTINKKKRSKIDL